jgi:DNA-directed RNA polymerase subunit RPC12/RpoP
MEKTKCPKCGYEWQTRTERPVECPNCKKRLWKYVLPSVSPEVVSDEKKETSQEQSIA